MCTLDSFSSVLACHAIKKSRKRVEESRTKLPLSLFFKRICFIGYIDCPIFYAKFKIPDFFFFLFQFRFRFLHFTRAPCPSVLMNSWQLIFHEEDETRSRLKFVAVCVARRLITLPAHVSLSGSICPHDIKPFATREFCNWLIRLSFLFHSFTLQLVITSSPRMQIIGLLYSLIIPFCRYIIDKCLFSFFFL